MIFLKWIKLPSADMEVEPFIASTRYPFSGTLCAWSNTPYPFKVLSRNHLEEVDLSDITIIYGGNGSGKTTLLNIVAERILAVRHSDFNDSPCFSQYVELCEISDLPTRNAHYLSSDDVFDYVINTRILNSGVTDYRHETAQLRASLRAKKDLKLKGLDDYDRWKDTVDSLNKSTHQFTKERTEKYIDTFSNGETAMHYFTQRIDRDGLYLLDEPENSLSVSKQLELKAFIEDSSRFYNCQFIISTHSPVLLSMKGARIYDIDSCPVTTKKWTELENVKEYFKFFDSHRDEFLN